MGGIADAANQFAQKPSQFVDSVVNRPGVPGIVSGPSNFVNNAWRGAHNSLTSALGGNKTSNAPQAPGQDAQAKAIIEKQQAIAAKYRQDLPNTKMEAGNLAEEAIRSDTSQGLKNVDKGSNSRGLLYSGLNLGERSDLIGGQAPRFAQAQSQANQAAEAEADRLDANAIGQGYTQANAGFSPSDVAYQSALQRQQGELESQKQLGQGVGGLLGNYFGNRAPSNNKVVASQPSNNFSQSNGMSYNYGQYSPYMGS